MTNNYIQRGSPIDKMRFSPPNFKKRSSKDKVANSPYITKK